MNEHATQWVVLTWRLPASSSTPRVTTWRTLRRMGAVLLTPGAAVVPFGEELLEQCEWLAQRIEESGGEAWVLPVTQLSAREEALIRERQRAGRGDEYAALRSAAEHLGSRRGRSKPRSRTVRALERGFEEVLARDHFGADGRARARRAIQRARREVTA
ncbi:MAG TPA: Chromate resistance protein ChrB [Candidatus Limnocylindrales bacterium]|nr:Chromate resistance protein ChrB [Candidatus Limnocylindrales bacterium]